jgi:hypothetical protein
MSCLGPHGPSDDDVDLYVMGRMPPSAAATLEAHLLMCESCQEELSSAKAYVAAIRAVLREQLADTSKHQPLSAGLLAGLDDHDATLIAMHGTDDGPILLYVCPSTTGAPWLARVVGGTVDAGASAESRSAAVHGCERVFHQLYREHICAGRCLTNDAANIRVRH